jgi:hypothetical protein
MGESKKTQVPELSREDQPAQSIYAISMSNRLSVAEIRLKKANRFSDSFDRELKEINDSIIDLSDSLLLGEDIRSSLDAIENRVTKFEQRIAT